MPTLRILPLPHHDGLPAPAYQSEGAAGFDLVAAVREPVTLEPRARVALPTGLAMALPAGHEGQVRPRSGLALKHGITCLNAPGTVDEDYRGEVMVILANLGDRPFTVERGMRIAQMVVAPVTRVAIETAAELPATARGEDGFGSTGV